MEFDINKVLTVNDIEKAKQYIGKKVYYGNTIEEIKCAVKKNEEPLLVLEDICYSYTGETTECFCFCAELYNCIYPYEEAKQEKYKPFTDKQMKHFFYTNQVFMYRVKGFDAIHVAKIFHFSLRDNLYLYSINTNIYKSVNALFEDFELSDDKGKTWHPFGCKVED